MPVRNGYFSDLASPRKLSAILKSSPEQISRVIQNRPSLYGRFSLPKRKGGERIITPPRPELRALQYKVKAYLDKKLHWSKYLHGGIEGRSTITNAAPHVGQEMVGNFDIKDFFPSTSEARIIQLLELKGAESGAAKMLAGLCCFEGHLPQGAPTSTCLANFAFLPIDEQLLRTSRRLGLVYTRFVDDITISGSRRLIGFKGAVNRMIRVGGYETSLDALTGRDKPQIVTGIVVNEKMRPAREFISHLKAQVRACWAGEAEPEVVAADEGLTVVQLRNRFRGRIAHVARFDKKLAREIRGLMARITWSRRSAVVAPGGA